MVWKTFTYHWQWQLKSSPAELWPYVADTHRFNQASQLPAIDYTEIPRETGGSRRLGRTSKFGVTVKYEDYPFEWIKEQEFSNLRLFEKGPLARTHAKLTLTPNAAGTLLEYSVEVTPANLLGAIGIPYQFGWEMRRNFEQVFRQIDEALQNRVEHTFELAVTPLSRSAKRRLQSLGHSLAEQGHNPDWIGRLTRLLSHEADLNLVRMRPYLYARQWNAPHRDILELFLSAAKLGLLKMRWDLMCPLCRGAKFTASSLDEVEKGVHCPTCNINFEADFAKNVELTFTPHPQIRTVYDESYCIGGPMVTPHILVHQIIDPGQTKTLPPVELPAGGYRLRTQNPEVEQWVKLDNRDEGQIEKFTVQADAEALTLWAFCGQQPVEPAEWLAEDAQTAGLMLSPTEAGRSAPESNQTEATESRPIIFELTNEAPYPQQIYVERADWYANAVSAAQVTALQHFRDLFSDEVLRPGEEIGVQGMTILFSDLVGSTALYNRWGDAASYALVREQFAFLQRVVRDHNGAIVKTIGDAIMAAFSDPAHGVGAALAIQKEIHQFNADHPDEPLIIKLGLHFGPCIAVNLNGRLDYFGTTVNLAARLEGQSRGGDIVISEALRTEPVVSRLLKVIPVTITCFETAVKGFDEHFKLYRVQYSDKKPP